MTKRYEDLGLVIQSASLAPAESVRSEWFDGMTWVRGLLASVDANGTFALDVEGRDREGRICIVSGGNGIPEIAGWACVSVAAPLSFGYSFRIVVTNNGQAPASISVAAQVVG